MDLFKSDAPMEAYDKLAELKKYNEIRNDPKINEFIASEPMQTLEEDVDIYKNFHENFIDNELSPDWNIYKNKPELKIYYRQEGGLNTITLYMEKVVKAPIVNTLATLAEGDLYKEWIPLVKRS